MPDQPQPAGRHRQVEQQRSGNPLIDVCNVCHDRPSQHFDDFYGYLCNICYFKHPLSRKTNPWTGAQL